MAKLSIKKASTDVSVYVFIQASNVTTGAGLTGLTFETASLVASYVRPLGSRAALTLATQTVTGAHSDGGFVEVDATNMPGVYRLDLSDAVCATGVPSVVVMLKGAANMAPLLLEIQLTDFDLNDASPNVTVADIANDAITAASIATGAIDADAIADSAIDAGSIATGAITNAKFAAGAIDASAIATDAIGADEIAAGAVTKIQTGLATPTNITAGTITTVTNLTNLPTMPAEWITASGLKTDAVDEIVDGVWNEAIADHTATTTFGGKNQKVVPSETINDYKADVSALTNVTLAATQTGVTIPTVTAVTNGVTLADDAITSAKFDENTAFPVKKADALTTELARKDSASSYMADVSGLATSSALTAVDDLVDDLETRLTAVRAGYLDKLNVSGTLAHSNDADTYKADVSAITGASLSATGIDAILDEIVVGTYTMRQILKLMAAKMHGKATGGGTTSIKYTGLDNVADVIIETVDTNGNRSAVSLTV
jgi:hypothetical protein